MNEPKVNTFIKYSSTSEIAKLRIIYESISSLPVRDFYCLVPLKVKNGSHDNIYHCTLRI